MPRKRMFLAYHTKTGERRSGAIDKAFKNDDSHSYKFVLRNLYNKSAFILTSEDLSKTHSRKFADPLSFAFARFLQ